jgi:hypothetical protein
MMLRRFLVAIPFLALILVAQLPKPGGGGSGGGGSSSAPATPNAQTGTTYTITATDCLNGVVTLSNASAITVTVPASLGAACQVTLIQLGAGAATLSPTPATSCAGGPPCIVQRQGFTSTAGVGAVALLIAYSADHFSFTGDVQ